MNKTFQEQYQEWQETEISNLKVQVAVCVNNKTDPGPFFIYKEFSYIFGNHEVIDFVILNDGWFYGKYIEKADQKIYLFNLKPTVNDIDTKYRQYAYFLKSSGDLININPFYLKDDGKIQTFNPITGMEI